jgi:hypothetical protein
MGKYEPVRRYIYSLLAPIIALLVFYGITTDEAAALWVAIASGVLGIGATEAARARVTPTARTR